MDTRNFTVDDHNGFRHVIVYAVRMILFTRAIHCFHDNEGEMWLSLVISGCVSGGVCVDVSV